MTDLLQRTLAQLILRHPFLSSLALRLERLEDPSTKTAWTDGVHLAVNPAWLARLTDVERVGLVAHECYHVALGHHLRRGGREPRRWNRACDYAVNALLAADGFPLFPGALLDPAFGDASAEAIYNRLPSEPADGSDGSLPPPSSAPAERSSSPPPSPSEAPPSSPPAPGARPGRSTFNITEHPFAARPPSSPPTTSLAA